jgi:hypothetical protein
MNAEKKTANLAGSELPVAIKDLPVHEKGSDKKIGSDEKALAISGGAFTTFFTWRANGVFKKVRFNHSGINANSRVFVSISEFNSDARINRFIGDARMAVYNVTPFNGGFFAWVEISWGSPLNARFDVFVEP